MPNEEKFDLISSLKKTCHGCKLSTIKTYARNVRRLAKLSGLSEVPSTKGWLFGPKGKSLLKKIERELPLTSARHLYTAGSQAARMYSDERSHMWVSAMNTASLKYAAHRNKQQKSNTEKSNWPTSGYKILGKSASIIKRKVTELLQKKELTHETAYEVQKYIIMLLFSHHAFRASEPSSWYLKPSTTENTLLRPRGSRKYVVTNRVHKTSKAMGETQIKLDSAVSKALSKYLPKIKKIAKHDYFLSTKAGTRLSAAALSKLVIRISKSTVGKNIGVRMGRVLKATKNREIIEKVERLRQEMGHSAKTQKTYIRKD